MSEISKEDITRLAALSRLTIKESDREKLLAELRSIKKLLDEVALFNEKNPPSEAALQSFDVLRFEEGVANAATLRSDEAREGLAREESEKLAPQFAMGHFVIPKVI